MRSLFDRLFKNDLRLAQKELARCKSFVRIAIHETDSKYTIAPIYHVTGFDFKENRLNYFMLDHNGDFSIPMPKRTQVEFLDAGRHDLLSYNHEFNRKLAALYRQLDNNREELRGMRIYVGSCARSNNPVYLTSSGQYHKLRRDEQAHWPEELPFKYITLYQQAPGIDHYYAFGYHANRGTTTIIPNVSKNWEPDPYYKNLQQEREAKLVKEYNEYLKADHFENGDLIQIGTEMPVVFMRYTDPERTGIMVYPNGEIKGIRQVMRYKLIQRRYRQNLEEAVQAASN